MITVIFDLEVFKGYKESNGSRAGIYFCGFELLQYFSKNPEIKLYLYANSTLLASRKIDDFVKDNFPYLKVICKKQKYCKIC